MIDRKLIKMKQIRFLFVLPFVLSMVAGPLAVLSLSGCSADSDKPSTVSGSTYYQGKMNADTESGLRKRRMLSAGGGAVQKPAGQSTTN